MDQFKNFVYSLSEAACEDAFGHENACENIKKECRRGLQNLDVFDLRLDL